MIRRLSAGSKWQQTIDFQTKRCLRSFCELGAPCRGECLATRLNLLNFKEKLQNTLPHGNCSPEKGGYADMRICNGKDLPTHSNMLSIDGSEYADT